MSEKIGQLKLVAPDGKLRLTDVADTEQHWAHPVIYQGVLYIRHGDTLMAFKVK